MKHVGLTIGISAIIAGTCILSFGNGFGLVLLVLGIICTIREM